jgi:hypothetical protein
MKTPNGVGGPVSFKTSRDTSAQKTTSPGILVLSRMMELLHVNRRAMELTDQSEKGAAAPIRCVLSRPVLEVCAEVHEALDRYVEAGIWVPLEVRKIVSSPERWILLRGFGLLDRNAIDHSRIVIVLDEVGFAEKDWTQPSQAYVQPYPSQRMVAEVIAAR